MAAEKETDVEASLAATALQHQITELKRELARLIEIQRDNGLAPRVSVLERAIVDVADVLQAIYPNALSNDQSLAVAKVMAIAEGIRKPKQEGVTHVAA